VENKLPVQISGYFLLGLFDKNHNFLRTVDFEYSTVEANGYFDLIYQMEDYSDLLDQEHYVNILYSKYFSNLPSLHDTLALSKNQIYDKLFDVKGEEPDELERMIINQ